MKTPEAKRQLRTLELLTVVRMQEHLYAFEHSFVGRPWAVTHNTGRVVAAMTAVRQAQIALAEEYNRLAKGLLPED